MRIAVSSSPGCSTVIRVMSVPGPTKYVGRVHHALAAAALANHHLRVERDQRRRGVRRAHRHAAIRAENRVLAVDRCRRVGVADVAAGAVAVPAAAVVPAARILRHVAAERSLVSNLRRGDEPGRLGKHAELLADSGVLGHFGQRGRRADLEAAVGVA